MQSKVLHKRALTVSSEMVVWNNGIEFFMKKYCYFRWVYVFTRFFFHFCTFLGRTCQIFRETAGWYIETNSPHCGCQSVPEPAIEFSMKRTDLFRGCAIEFKSFKKIKPIFSTRTYYLSFLLNMFVCPER